MKTKELLKLSWMLMLPLFISCSSDSDDPTEEKEDEKIEIRIYPDNTPSEYVDMGTSVYWATCNMGAKKATDLGNYYSWGEPDAKKKFGRNNYPYYDKTTNTYQSLGKNIGHTKYDAASAKWGKGWRMPTMEEWKELYDKAKSWQIVAIDGVPGYQVTASNGNQIFIPAAGAVYGEDRLDLIGEQMNYWTCDEENDGFAKSLQVLFSSKIPNFLMNTEKCAGYSIRPVREKKY